MCATMIKVALTLIAVAAMGAILYVAFRAGMRYVLKDLNKK